MMQSLMAVSQLNLTSLELQQTILKMIYQALEIIFQDHADIFIISLKFNHEAAITMKFRPK